MKTYHTRFLYLGIEPSELNHKLRAVTLRVYFRKWRLKLNTNKTVCSTFHLTNRLADYELSVTTDGVKIPFEKTPKYLGVTLDRTLSFRQHLTDTAAKTFSRCSLLKRLTGSKWGADFTTLRTSALGLCFSVAEYCSPVWGNSAHCSKLDASLNECMRVISGCIKATPTALLPVLCGIEPPDIRRKKGLISLYNRSQVVQSHLLHETLSQPLNPRLKSRNPLSTRTHHLISSNINTASPDSWAKSAWKTRWSITNYQLRDYVPHPSSKPPGCNLDRRQWVLLNRLRSGYGRYGSFMLRIGLRDNAECICGEIQTPQHVLVCPRIGIRGNMGLVDDEFRLWLRDCILDL